MDVPTTLNGYLVPTAGFEPATYRLGGDCSIQLSYEGLRMGTF